MWNNVGSNVMIRNWVGVGVSIGLNDIGSNAIIVVTFEKQTLIFKEESIVKYENNLLKSNK